MALLRVSDLGISFPHPAGTFQAVRDVTFSIHHGETLCVVGESGSGKSLTALAIMGLLPEHAALAGSITFERDVLTKGQALHRGHRWCGRGLAMIFQEPMAALNPSLTVERAVGEGYATRLGARREAVRKRVCEVLAAAGIPDPPSLLGLYPWQLSGGLAQRVIIASALILEPKLLIADEPTTALDVTTQAQILRLLAELRDRHGLAMMFITHDLSVAAAMGGNAVVMKNGEIVERGETADLLNNPTHPFTRSLTACTPRAARREGRTTLCPVAEDEESNRAGGRGSPSVAATVVAPCRGSETAAGGVSGASAPAAPEA